MMSFHYKKTYFWRKPFKNLVKCSYQNLFIIYEGTVKIHI